MQRHLTDYFISSTSEAVTPFDFLPSMHFRVVLRDHGGRQAPLRRGRQSAAPPTPQAKDAKDIYPTDYFSSIKRELVVPLIHLLTTLNALPGQSPSHGP